MIEIYQIGLFILAGFFFMKAYQEHCNKKERKEIQLEVTRYMIDHPKEFSDYDVKRHLIKNVKEEQK